MITLQSVKEKMLADERNWSVFLMDFVDDFRYHRNPAAIAESIPYTHPQLDPLLASTAEKLCDELGIECPMWLASVPACKDPWFVSGMENLKAIALAESPLRFRIRKIFVLENFLSRV
jgi:hypothetical protein